MKPFYVVVTNPFWGEHTDGSGYVPINTRLLFEKQQVFGTDNICRFMTSQEKQQFINAVYTNPTGTWGVLSWQRET